MAASLTDSHRQRWEQYRRAEAFDTRAEKLRLLDVFVEELLQSPPATWRPWALAVAAQVVDGGADITVRRALFERVLFPALAAGLDEGVPGCARWLAGLETYLAHCPACRERLGPGRASPRALLRLAVATDPADGRSRDRLIRLIADGFDYALHELPTGVLYSHDGATPAECDLLAAELAEFRSLLAADGRAAAYADLVEACAFHFAAYKQYLLEWPVEGGYAGFPKTPPKVAGSGSPGFRSRR